MTEYYLITLTHQECVSSRPRTCTLAIDESPFEWLMGYKNTKHQCCLLNVLPMTEQEYVIWGEDEQTIYQ